MLAVWRICVCHQRPLVLTDYTDSAAPPGNNLTNSADVMPPDASPVTSRESERVIRKGWLTKDSGLKSLFMKTQKRWCVLKTGYFQYFHSESEDGRSEVISLGSMESVSIETRRSIPLLVIKTTQRSFTFTSNDKSANATVFEWLQDITRVLIDAPTAAAAAAAGRAPAHTVNGPQPMTNSYAYGAPAAAQAPQSVVLPANGTVMLGIPQQPQMVPRPAPMSYAPLRGNAQPQWQPQGELVGHADVNYPAQMRPIPTRPRPDVHPMLPMGSMRHNWSMGNGEMPVNALPHAGLSGVVPKVGNGALSHQETMPTPDYGTQWPEAYDLYSSMYEHDALATRTGMLISADVSPSMAAMSDPPRPPPMHH